MMATAVMVMGSSEPRPALNPGTKGPSQRQEEILAAYVDNPNAAAVGRALKTNERHVRRIVTQFASRLDELRHERDEERRERAHAREAKLQAWAEASLDESLRQLESLAGSPNEAVALRAVKTKISLALHLLQATSPPVFTEVARSLGAAERRVAHRISDIEAAVAAGPVDHD